MQPSSPIFSRPTISRKAQIKIVNVHARYISPICNIKQYVVQRERVEMASGELGHCQPCLSVKETPVLSSGMYFALCTFHQSYTTQVCPHAKKTLDPYKG